MQLTKSKWRNDPLKFFLFPLPGCPSSEFTKVRIKNRGLGQVKNMLHSGSENTNFYKEQFESNSTANESLLYEQSIIMDCVSEPSSLFSVLLSEASANWK